MIKNLEKMNKNKLEALCLCKLDEFHPSGAFELAQIALFGQAFS